MAKNKNILDAVSEYGEAQDLVSQKLQKEAQKRAEQLNKIELALFNKGWDDKEARMKRAQEIYLAREQNNLKLTAEERRKQAQEEHEQRMADLQLEYDTAETNEDRLAALKKLNNAKAAEQAVKLANKAISAAVKGGDNIVEAGLSVFSNYMSGIEARMQGTGSSFRGMLSNITGNLTASPYVKQVNVIENLSKLVDQGIAYNVEQRAFLETISDKIATTFDATNGTLLRLIRVQQADTTAARLGLEADLTRYLNKNYKDTSYLSEQFDTVSEALYEATAIAGRNQGVELEGVVQKWLGSLYSVGASSNLVQSLAQGIGYLGSGDISALSSNESLQNLLVMAASRGGLDYASMLTQGASAQQVNALLSNVVKYIQEIGSTQNLAVRSQYAQMFGMTISDMTALLNLSSADLVDISNNMLSYSDTISEVNNQLRQVGGRTHFSEMIDNVLSNTALTLGMGVANNIVSYGIYRAGELLDLITGEAKLPTVNVLGSGVDLDMTYGQAMKLGVLGVSSVGTLIQALSSLGNAGGLSLAGWGASDFLTRGGLSTTAAGISTGLSSSAFIGNTNGTSIASQSLTGAQQQAETITGQAPTANERTEKLQENISSILDQTKTLVTLLSSITTGASTVNVNVSSGNYVFGA